MRHWVEVTITVTPETEEAIANALWELGSGGVVQTGSGPSGSTGPHERVTGFWPDRPGVNEKIDRITRLWEELRGLGMADGACRIATRRVSEDEWAGNWKARLGPVRVSDRLLVAPPWSEIPRGDGLLAVRINPGTGFGTGGHETTQLCLRQLEKRVRPGDRVLDVGSGSGVLSITAILLGATWATGVDVDPETIGNALENARLNGVGDRVDVYAGRMDHPAVDDRYRIIVSNISAASLTALLPGFSSRLHPEGELILSGLLIEEAPSFEATLTDRGFTLLERETRGVWWAGVAGRKAGQPTGHDRWE